MKNRRFIISFTLITLIALVCASLLITMWLIREKPHTVILLKPFETEPNIEIPINIPGNNTDEVISVAYTHAEEKGKLGLLSHQLYALPKEHEDDARYYVMPFFMDTQGTGIFWNLVLLRQTLLEEAQQLHQVDTYFLGDRIKNIEIQIKDKITKKSNSSSLAMDTSTMKVSYLDYAPEQAMAETPSLPKDLWLSVDAEGFQLNHETCYTCIDS